VRQAPPCPGSPARSCSPMTGRPFAAGSGSPGCARCKRRSSARSGARWARGCRSSAPPGPTRASTPMARSAISSRSRSRHRPRWARSPAICARGCPRRSRCATRPSRIPPSTRARARSASATDIASLGAPAWRQEQLLRIRTISPRPLLARSRRTSRRLTHFNSDLPQRPTGAARALRSRASRRCPRCPASPCSTALALAGGRARTVLRARGGSAGISQAPGAQPGRSPRRHRLGPRRARLARATRRAHAALDGGLRAAPRIDLAGRRLSAATRPVPRPGGTIAVRYVAIEELSACYRPPAEIHSHAART